MALRVSDSDPFRMSVRVPIDDDATRTEAYDMVVKHQHCAIALIAPRLSSAFHLLGDLEPADIRVWRARRDSRDRANERGCQSGGQKDSAIPGDGTHVSSADVKANK